MTKIIKQRDINLLTAMNRRTTGGYSAARRPALFIACGVALLALLTSVIFYFVQTSGLIRDRKNLTGWLENPDTKKAYGEAVRLRAAAAEATRKVTETDTVVQALATDADLRGEDLLSIYEMAGDTVEIYGFRYDRTDRVLTLNAQCKTPARAPIFVAKLRADHIFDSVSYSGYTGSAYVTQGTPQVNAETGDVSLGYITNQVYLFTVTGLVAAPAPDGSKQRAPLQEDEEK